MELVIITYHTVLAMLAALRRLIVSCTAGLIKNSSYRYLSIVLPVTNGEER